MCAGDFIVYRSTKDQSNPEQRKSNARDITIPDSKIHNTETVNKNSMAVA
jgi:hypothetical protein